MAIRQEKASEISSLKDIFLVFFEALSLPTANLPWDLLQRGGFFFFYLIPPPSPTPLCRRTGLRCVMYGTYTRWF